MYFTSMYTSLVQLRLDVLHLHVQLDLQDGFLWKV
jgi:hypothetical protein